MGQTDEKIDSLVENFKLVEFFEFIRNKINKYLSLYREMFF